MITAGNFKGLAIAAGVSLLLTLAYFALTRSWTNLANPIPGTIAVTSGLIGFAVAVLIERRRGRIGAHTEDPA